MSDIQEVIALLKSLKIDFSPEIQAKLQDERITKSSLILLTEEDLKELGFRMGERKVIWAWITTAAQGEATHQSSHGVQENRLLSPTSMTPTSMTVTASPSPVIQGSTKFKNFRVDELMERCTKTSINGPDLVLRLKAGECYTSQERAFLVRTAGRYLMNNCFERDRPTKQEKIDMSQSIIDVFPILKDPVTGGYEFMYDVRSHTGYLEAYVRGRRHRSADITTLWTHSASRQLDLHCTPTTSASEEERTLRERRPNTSNASELLVLMEKTRDERRAWIKNQHPSITEILQKYPRLRDVPDAVRDEFRAITGSDMRLAMEWTRHKSAILKIAEKDVLCQQILKDIVDEFDEDNKSIIAFKCLVCMLPTPPPRGVKCPRPAPEKRMLDFFIDFENASVEESMNELQKRQPVASTKLKNLKAEQPLLFKSQGRYFVKGDNIAIPLADCSCFVDAVEFLYMLFYVFDCAYPSDLRYLYGYLEKVMQMPSSVGRSSVLFDLQTKLVPHLSGNQTVAAENA